MLAREEVQGNERWNVYWKSVGLIVRTANELLVKEKVAKKIKFFDAECDDITDEK